MFACDSSHYKRTVDVAVINTIKGATSNYVKLHVRDVVLSDVLTLLKMLSAINIEVNELTDEWFVVSCNVDNYYHAVTLKDIFTVDFDPISDYDSEMKAA